MKTFTYFLLLPKAGGILKLKTYVLTFKIKKSLQQYQKDFRKLRYQP
jgi:hypothetical protein